MNKFNMDDLVASIVANKPADVSCEPELEEDDMIEEEIEKTKVPTRTIEEIIAQAKNVKDDKPETTTSKIIACHAAGMAPGDIGRALDISSQHARNTLIGKGITPHTARPKCGINKTAEIRKLQDQGLKQMQIWRKMRELFPVECATMSPQQVRGSMKGV